MGTIFNKGSQTEKRRLLRNNATKAEEILWQRLKGKQVENHKFRRQVSITEYVVDFYCPKLKLAIEVDGVTHSSQDEIEYDIDRQTKIEALGIVFLRFRNEEIYKNLEKVVNDITQKVILLGEAG
jgi:very-short-patch-repair endonuclease